MNQAELRKMAEERILDAKVLLNGGRWAFAYYVAGYAVECALKSCVLVRMIETGGVFKDKKFAEKCWTHDFGELVELAGLTTELNKTFAGSAAAVAVGGPPGGSFVVYWETVKRWKESSRYEDTTQVEAEKLYEAITHDPHGVLKWIQNYW
ncbi:MAG TPA: HEPN domain-containing protein [Gemmataceae bacterium]|jgi:hypothetical protein